MTAIPKVKDLSGKVFGRWTVQGLSHISQGYSFWICKCACGNQKTIRRNALTQGRSTSCGCRQQETLIAGRTTHGCAGQNTKEYRSWEGIIRRCTKPNFSGWIHYGGRGISICDRWRTSFQDFLADMGHAPTQNHSVERIDNNGNYEPGNCKWATKKEQARNTSRNRTITVDGLTKTLAEWVELRGLNYNTVLYRLRRGWSERDAIEIPFVGGYGTGLVPGGDSVLSDPFPGLE